MPLLPHFIIRPEAGPYVSVASGKVLFCQNEVHPIITVGTLVAKQVLENIMPEAAVGNILLDARFSKIGA